MRALLIAVLLVVGVGGTAEARRGGGAVVFNSGQDIIPIRDLTADETAGAVGFTKLGYKHDLIGVFWQDIWRWGGEFVVYDGGTTYAPLDDEQLAYFGNPSVPWRYHLPPGLLIILALIELAVITKQRRRLKMVLSIGGVLALIAGAFYLMGLDWEFLIPLFLAGHHVIGSYFALKLQREAEEREAERVRSAAIAAAAPVQEGWPPTMPDDMTTSSGRHKRPSAVGTPPPARGDDAATVSRPSQPIVIERATTAPAVVPMKTDDSVEGPKLLR